MVVNGRTSGGTTAACDGSNPSQVGCVNVRVDEFRQQTIVEAWMRVLGVTVGGMRVAVIGIATPPIMRTPEALAVFGPASFGLDRPFLPVETLEQPVLAE